MAQVQSKITTQGQVSVPVSVRQALGVKPGSVLEWISRDGVVVVKRATRSSTTSVHEALFSGPSLLQVTPKTPEDLKLGIKALMRRKHASR